MANEMKCGVRGKEDVAHRCRTFGLATTWEVVVVVLGFRVRTHFKVSVSTATSSSGFTPAILFIRAPSSRINVWCVAVFIGAGIVQN
eukprot:COSAG02_NODE_23_length_52893_cov_58.101868_41_plen_87_part_00